MSSETKHSAGIVDKWLEDDNLMLLRCWARDGYTYQDIADRIGITAKALSKWRAKFPEIDEAVKQGREIVDYKVENALLKSALGYKTKEVKVTTTIRNGKLIETIKETTSKEQAPNVTACQVWLFNRLPDKWKRNRDNVVELNEEDSTIQISVVRGSKKENDNTAGNKNSSTEDKEWIEDVNQEIEIKRNEEYYENKKKEKNKKDTESSPEVPESKKSNRKVLTKAKNLDRDYWPDDWEE